MTPEERAREYWTRKDIPISEQRIADLLRAAENDALEEAVTYLGRFHADMPRTNCQNAIRGLKRTT